MILSRRRVLTGLLAAPMIVRTPGLLMPVRSIKTPDELILARMVWIRAEIERALTADLMTDGALYYNDSGITRLMRASSLIYDDAKKTL